MAHILFGMHTLLEQIIATLLIPCLTIYYIYILFYFFGANIEFY